MADPRERFPDLLQVIRMAVDRMRADMWTALPVKLVENSDGFSCKLQSTIKLKQYDDYGNEQDVQMPEFHDVPVQFSAGGGFTITHPISKDDEGIAVFSSRSIDHWWDKGDVQPQALQRWHSPSDAMYIPGIRSKPRALGGNPDGGPTRGNQGHKPSTNSVQIRTDAGDVYVEVTSDGVNILASQKVTIKAATEVVITCPTVKIEGDLVVTGEITGQSGGSRSASNVTLSNHRHSNVQNGPAESGPPVDNT